MWIKIVNFFSTESMPRKIVLLTLIVVGFLTSAFITAIVFRLDARDFAEGWRKDLQPASCAGDANANLSVTIDASDGDKARMGGQFQQLKIRMKHHLDLFIKFYSYYFSTVIMVGVLASVAAICLLFITSKGWVPANPYAKTIFLVATASATYCAAFPSIFQQQQNIDDNKRLYLEYGTLANEMCSYATTGENSDGDQQNPNDFIHYTDRQFKRLNKIAVGFDVSKIPDFTQAFSKGTVNSTPGASPAAATKPSSGKAKSNKPTP
jgi:hypothetical protein